MLQRLVRFVRQHPIHIDASRFGPLHLSLALFVVASTLTRLALSVLYYDQIADNTLSVPVAFVAGFVFDLFAALALGIPYALYLLFMPNRWLASRASHWLTDVVYFGHLFLLFYIVAAEIVFFGEFNSRFNFVAVDYLATPHEVTGNIRDTYPVYKILAADAALALVTFLAVRRKLLASLKVPADWVARGRFAAIYLTPFALGVAALNITMAQFSDNRVMNEIALNGVYSFGYALTHNEIDYDAHYARIEPARAFARARELVATPNAQYLHPEDPQSIDRMVRGNGKPRRMNVVWVLEESMGSLFVPSLHPEGARSMHEFDAIARDGLLFTGIYATGNRTVRGIEASATGLPPLPGRALPKRSSGVNLFSLASVFGAQGYQTAFIYGGMSYFDNIRGFALGNGYERVIDESDFSHKTFSTVWGVCDEDLFDNTLAELDRMHASGKPFFTTVLTVSNHSPFTYPKGKIAENPDEKRRENAMRYSDYALARFLRAARDHAFFDNTLFVVMGDHGARVYGRQQIPLTSYEIPVLLYAPKLIPKGRRIDQLGSQMDIAPTVLGLLDFDYPSQFYGRDLMRMAPASGRALLSHNTNVALYDGRRLAVLGIRHARELWERIPGSDDFRRLPVESDPQLVEDAIAYYQSAATLYKEGRFHPLAPRPAAGAGPGR